MFRGLNLSIVILLIFSFYICIFEINENVKAETLTYLTHEITITAHSDEVFSISWSPDGSKLASASEDNTIKIWNTTSWENIQVLRRRIRAL